MGSKNFREQKNEFLIFFDILKVKNDIFNWSLKNYLINFSPLKDSLSKKAINQNNVPLI